MVYQYIAYSESGALVKGKLSAASEEAATELLSYAGYQTVSLKQYTPLFNLGKLSASLFPVKPAEIMLLYRQLAMLLESGTNIATSLELLQEQVDNRTLKKVLGEVTSDIRSGGQLSTAIAKHPGVFPAAYCRLLAVGEQTGDLETVLRQVADYMEKEAATAKEIKGALMYPIITFLVTIVVVCILVIFVLPSFADLYTQLGVELPTVARLLITIGEWAQGHLMHIFLALLVVIGSVFLYIKTPRGRYMLDKLLISIPKLGRVNLLNELARYCRSMSLLFSSGLPLTEIMPLVIQGSRNRVLAEALTVIQKDMVKGEGLSRPMSRNKLFLPMMVQMVRVGEETGNLDVTLLAVARSYETDAQDKMRSLIALIQPTMTVIMGVVIGFVAMTLMSAMTAMYGEGV